MGLMAVTVLGHDRPGIIASVTQVLATLGLNLEDSTMTLLRGHFAFMLICAGDDQGPSADEVRAALAPVVADGTLDVAVRTVPEEHQHELGGPSVVVSVHGGDRPGIVSAVAGRIAAAGGNITDLSTRLTGDLYVAVAEVDLPPGSDVDALATGLHEVAAQLGVDVSVRGVDVDVL
jgi:glycine cleavage system transcriptional repressor